MRRLPLRRFIQEPEHHQKFAECTLTEELLLCAAGVGKRFMPPCEGFLEGFRDRLRRRTPVVSRVDRAVLPLLDGWCRRAGLLLLANGVLLSVNQERRRSYVMDSGPGGTAALPLPLHFPFLGGSGDRIRLRARRCRRSLHPSCGRGREPLTAVGKEAAAARGYGIIVPSEVSGPDVPPRPRPSWAPRVKRGPVVEWLRAADQLRRRSPGMRRP